MIDQRARKAATNQKSVTVVFQLEVDDSSQDESNVGHSISFEGQQRREQLAGEFL